MREKFLKSGPGKKYLKNRLKRFLSLTGQVKGARPVRVRTQNVSVNSNRGYIALITVVVVMAVLLIIGSVVAGAGYFGRFSQLEYESKGVSLGLAEACVNAAFLDIVKDPSINNSAYDKCVSVGDNCLSSIRRKVCKICSITNVGSSKEIITRATFNKAISNLKVTGTLGASNFNVLTWEEFPNYTGSCNVP